MHIYLLSTLKIRTIMSNENINTQVETPLVSDGFFVKPIYGDYKVKIRFSDIIWVEADNNHSHIHIKDSQPVSVCFKLQQVEKMLPANNFIRISRSEIINLHMVDRYCGNIICLERCNHQFYVTDKHRETVFSCFKELTKEI